MQKRGQVSVFAIVGVVLVILVALFFYARSEFGFFVEPTTFLSDKAKPIQDNLKECVDKSGAEALNTFGKQGGEFFPGRYRLYDGYYVKYFCWDIPGVPECTNRMPTIDEMLGELGRKIEIDVNSCVDKKLVESGFGYEVSAGLLTTSIDTTGNSLLITADYDVELRKGESKTTVNPVTISFDAPIEELYAVAVDIVNSEARVGSFEQLLYMLNERGQYIINVDKPYPDKIYKLNKKDSSFELWFAIEGERGV